MDVNEGRVYIAAVDTGDKELNTISLCVNAIRELDDSQQRSLMAYLNERFSQ